LAEAVSLPVLKTTLPASWDESWFGAPAVYDLDGDGKPEIIAARHSVLCVWNAQDALVWRAAVGTPGTKDEIHGTSRQYAGPVVGDLDGKGKGEIAIAYGNQVAVYEHDGKLKAGWPKTFPGPAGEVRALAAADLDLDGAMEILAEKTGNGPATMAWKLDGAAVPGWPQSKDCEKCNDYGGFNQTLGATDLDADGKPEVVAGYDASYIGIFSGEGKPLAANAALAGPWASSVPLFHDTGLARQGWGADGNDRDEATNSPPVFGDLDGDGKPEVIFYSNHEKAGDTLESLGNCLWALHSDMTRAKGFEKPLCSDTALFKGYLNNIVETAPIPSLGNLTGDARPEIVVPSMDGCIRAYSPDGALLWKYTYDVAGEPWIMASESVIGDLNQDGVPEIVFTTYSVDHFVSHLTILDNAGRMQRKVTLDKRGAMGAPTLADTDGDGKLDIVVSLKDVLGGGKGGVQIWTVASAGANAPLWPTGRGSFLRAGVTAGPTPPIRLSPSRPRWNPLPVRGRAVDVLGIPGLGAEGKSARLLYLPRM
jgi:hypothetical protein